VIAFVAGSTGYTGREVVRVLRARGMETVAHVRPDSGRIEAWRIRFEGLGARLDLTPWDLDALSRTLTALAPALVFALLGTTRARARRAAASGRDEGYQAVDYALTVLLYRAACSPGSRPRFMYLSSAGVRETGGNAYLAARAGVERELRAGPLPYTIVRPSFITGPDRDEFRPGERIVSRVMDGALGLAGLLGATRLRDRYRSTSNLTLAEAMVRLALDPAAAGRVVESEALRSPRGAPVPRRRSAGPR
jgi:uncharacterized protein YbjT (DUF2867 family)